MNKYFPSKSTSGVHASAYIVNSFRAKYPKISGDSYAKYWINDQGETLANHYLKVVGTTESQVHCLRHRFFLAKLNSFITQNPDGVFINIGAGFTNYPYLTPKKISTCEIDKPSILDLKKQKLLELEQAKILPPRRIEFLEIDDLNNLESIDRLFKSLNAWLNYRPCFVILEGVFFWISVSTISYLFECLSKLQITGSWIGVTCFQPQETNKEMFNKLVNFSKTDYGIAEFKPTTLPASFYHHLDSYQLLVHKNYLELYKECPTMNPIKDRSQVLEEDCYILARK